MTLAAFVAIALVAVMPTVGGDSTDSPTISYEIAPTFTLLEPITVSVTISNPSDTAASIDLGEDRTGHFQLRPTGTTTVVPVSRQLTAGGIMKGGLVTIGPHQQFQQQLLLNDSFVFDRPGMYEFTIRLLVPTSGPGVVSASESPSTSLSFRILPRNDRVLRERCASLAATVATVRDVDTYQQAAHQLVAVADPIVVPYIRKALDATDAADWILIAGLTRIGGPDARALTAELTRARDTERAALARSALQAFR